MQFLHYIKIPFEADVLFLFFIWSVVNAICTQWSKIKNVIWNCKVCIIRLVHICFEKSSSTFWKVRCCAHRTRCSCQKYNEDFSNFVAFSENSNFTHAFMQNSLVFLLRYTGKHRNGTLGKCFRSSLEGKFFHKEVNMMINFKTMQIVCITLKSHKKSTIRNIGSQSTRPIFVNFVTLNSVDFSVHNIFKTVGSWWTLLQRIPFTWNKKNRVCFKLSKDLF